jgi:hypothetical protein
MHVQAQRGGGGLFKFATTMLKGGGGLSSHFSCFMLKEDLVLIAQGTGWALGLVWRGMENLASIGIQLLDHAACSESPY